jgi:hypothetical protein
MYTIFRNSNTLLQHPASTRTAPPLQQIPQQQQILHRTITCCSSSSSSSSSRLRFRILLWSSRRMPYLPALCWSL